MSQTGARSAFSPFATRNRMSCSSLDMLGRDLRPALLLLQRVAAGVLHPVTAVLLWANLAAGTDDGTKASGRDAPRASKIAT